jgi:hypothetical protein
MDNSIANLERHQFNVDYILAHTAPEFISNMLIRETMSNFITPDPTGKYLEHICNNTTFEEFYCGHWHINKKIGRYNFVYKDIIQIC